MCERNLKSVIYLSFLWWGLRESHPVSGTERAPRLQCEVFWLVYGSNVCLFVCPRFCQTLNNRPKSFSVSSSWCPVSTEGLGSWTGGSEGCASGPHCPLQTGTDSLMANIKLSLGFMCLLPNKFILDQTELPAYARDKMFKWCKVVFSNYDPAYFFFPYPLTCNLKINTQAPPGCDNFSKQNWK